MGGHTPEGLRPIWFAYARLAEALLTSSNSTLFAAAYPYLLHNTYIETHL